MCSYIYIDSGLRDRLNYPNPAEFVVLPAQQANGWFREPRTVRATPPLQPRLLEFATSINVLDISVPYQLTNVLGPEYGSLPFGDWLTTQPHIFLSVFTQGYDDTNLISTLDNTLADARFTLTQVYVQYAYTAGAMDTTKPLWIHYTTRMEQVMRFARHRPMYFRLFDSNGVTLPIVDTDIPDDPDPTAQVHATFEVTPYIRDASYDNHLLSLSSA